ncbi:MAG TPA: CsiV family protein [Gammaproteobacteria bacterium]
MRSNFQRLLLSLLLGMAANFAIAADDEPRWYEIEIIVFENLNQPSDSSESWPSNPGIPDSANALKLVPADAANTDNNPPQAKSPAITAPALPETYPLVTNKDFKLAKQDTLLSDSGQYRPLLHVAWRQPVLSQETAKAVHIFSSMMQADGPASSNETLALPPQDGTSIQQNADSTAPLNVIDGTIKIALGKYLHMDMDLLYRTKAAARDEVDIFGFRKEEDSPSVFRMQQSRRVRSGEVHYFDHPAFGVIAIMTPSSTAAQPTEDVITIPLDETTPPAGQESDVMDPSGLDQSDLDPSDQGGDGF